MKGIKSKIPSTKQFQMTEIIMTKTDAKIYDLENRTLAFAKRVRLFIKNLRRTISNIEDGKQLIRASGSVGANYIEANESLSKKDFIMRIKICRKEAKECRYWLRLIDTSGDHAFEAECKSLEQESIELASIFGSILTRSE
jgi:four helix bundle protein